MIRVFGVLLASLGFGALLAAPVLIWPIRPGWFGAAVLIMAAVWARLYWNRRRATAGDDPGARERQAWHAMVGLGVVCGQLAMALLRGVDLHVGRGNTLALDNWTLIGAAMIGWLIVRPPVMDRDERDRQMADRGAHVGYGVLTGLLVVLLMVLGFAPPPVISLLGPFVLGNLLVVLILLAALAKYAAQLVGYWAASRPCMPDV